MPTCRCPLWPLLLLCVLLGLSTPAGAGTKYISPTGNNTANGDTEGTAWRTFRTALSRLRCGDTLIVLDGTYLPGDHGMIDIRNRPCSAGAPLTIRAKTRYGAWIADDGTNTAAQVHNSSYITFEGLRLSSQNGGAPRSNQGQPFWGKSSDHITVRQVLAHNPNHYCNCHVIG